MAVHLFSFFHLNLAYSSIEEDARPEVIQRCYWPLLHLIREQQLPAGIELSGYTLEMIHAIDASWVEELRALCEEGLAELIGSGYSQLIGPLVPAAVNHANQRIGMKVYERLLGFRPTLALVSEQAFSAGLIPIYRDAGYEAIIMEWDNPASVHPDWPSTWRYLPQCAKGVDGSDIPLIWNKSIPFQKFQRYAHGEMELSEYLAFLGDHAGEGERTFALYGNDVEVFDFRPGRFHTEATLGDESEWTRIARLYATLQADERFTLIRPGQVLDFLDQSGAGNVLQLESSVQPIPVKKQAKYNIMRWALSGQDDLGLNTRCWQLFQALAAQNSASEDDWKELCFLWSSDFRTHITEARWQELQGRLMRMQQRLLVESRETEPQTGLTTDTFQVSRDGVYLQVETQRQRLRLNCRRGLAVEGWWDKTVSSVPLVKTLPHGYFDHIQFGSDYYTGHFVLEIPGQHKITDLSAVTPTWDEVNGELNVRARVETPLGPVDKVIRINGERAELEIEHHFHWPSCPNGSLRLGHITLNPELFDTDNLFVRTHNGGDSAETFIFNNEPIDHLKPVSTLVSSGHGLGVTEGIVELGDHRHVLTLDVDKTAAAVTGHVLHAPVGENYLFRLVFSAMEMDDTSCQVETRSCFNERVVKWRLSSDN